MTFLDSNIVSFEFCEFTNIVLVLIVAVRFSKIRKGFLNTQPIVIKLHIDICDHTDHITHPSTVWIFKLISN